MVQHLRGDVVNEDYDEQIIADLSRKTREKRAKGQREATHMVMIRKMEKELDEVFTRRGVKAGWQSRQRTKFQGTARP